MPWWSPIDAAVFLASGLLAWGLGLRAQRQALRVWREAQAARREAIEHHESTLATLRDVQAQVEEWCP